MIYSTEHALEHLRHYLPSQASLKDFIHQNTLHGFQDRDFHQACFEGAEVFGYSTYLSLDEYRALYASGRIREDILIDRIRRSLAQRPPNRLGSPPPTKVEINQWLEKALYDTTTYIYQGRLGRFRQGW